MVYFKNADFDCSTFHKTQFILQLFFFQKRYLEIPQKFIQLINSCKKDLPKTVVYYFNPSPENNSIGNKDSLSLTIESINNLPKADNVLSNLDKIQNSHLYNLLLSLTYSKLGQLNLAEYFLLKFLSLDPLQSIETNIKQDKIDILRKLLNQSLNQYKNDKNYESTYYILKNYLFYFDPENQRTLNENDTYSSIQKSELLKSFRYGLNIPSVWILLINEDNNFEVLSEYLHSILDFHFIIDGVYQTVWVGRFLIDLSDEIRNSVKSKITKEINTLSISQFTSFINVLKNSSLKNLGKKNVIKNKEWEELEKEFYNKKIEDKTARDFALYKLDEMGVLTYSQLMHAIELEIEDKSKN